MKRHRRAVLRPHRAPPQRPTTPVHPVLPPPSAPPLRPAFNPSYVLCRTRLSDVLRPFRARKTLTMAPMQLDLGREAALVIPVSELNRRVRTLLENHFETVWVAGELSNVKQAPSGHW